MIHERGSSGGIRAVVGGGTRALLRTDGRTGGVRTMSLPCGAYPTRERTALPILSAATGSTKVSPRTGVVTRGRDRISGSLRSRAGRGGEQGRGGRGGTGDRCIPRRRTSGPLPHGRGGRKEQWKGRRQECRRENAARRGFGTRRKGRQRKKIDWGLGRHASRIGHERRPLRRRRRRAPWRGGMGKERRRYDVGRTVVRRRGRGRQRKIVWIACPTTIPDSGRPRAGSFRMPHISGMPRRPPPARLTPVGGGTFFQKSRGVVDILRGEWWYTTRQTLPMKRVTWGWGMRKWKSWWHS